MYRIKLNLGVLSDVLNSPVLAPIVRQRAVVAPMAGASGPDQTYSHGENGPAFTDKRTTRIHEVYPMCDVESADHTVPEGSFGCAIRTVISLPAFLVTGDLPGALCIVSSFDR